MAISVDPNEPFHVLLGEHVTPVSLDVLDSLYQDDTIGDDTLIWQEGLGEWLRLQVVLAELEKQDPSPQPQLEAPHDPDKYYVSFDKDDVRLITLDQLDKFYQLEVVDDATLVWQPGFTEWVPLAVLIGEPDAPAVSIAPSLSPGRPAPSAAPYVPSSGRAPSLAPSLAPAASTRPAAPSLQPVASAAPVPSAASSRPFPHSLPTPVSTAPVSLLPRPSGAPGFSVAPLSSLSPHAVSPHGASPYADLGLTTPPMTPAPASPWFRRGLLVAAAAAGLLVVQRNGMMQEWATGAGQGDTWARLESKLGGASLETPQGVSAWLSDVSARHGLGSLARTEPVQPSAREAESPEAKPRLQLAALPQAEEESPRPEAAVPETAEQATAPVQSAPAQAAPAQAMSDMVEKMRAKLSGQKPSAPVRPATSARPISSGKKAPPPAKKKKSSGADAWDPMNGTL